MCGECICRRNAQVIHTFTHTLYIHTHSHTHSHSHTHTHTHTHTHIHTHTHTHTYTHTHTTTIRSCLINVHTYTQGEPEFYGPACECDDSRCGRVDGLLCSGRGTCTCNGCQCNVEPTTSQPYINGDLQACECTPATNCIDPRNNTVSTRGVGW